MLAEIIGILAAVRIDLVGTTADFRAFGPRRSLPINHLLCENRRTASRIGEDGLIWERAKDNGIFANASLFHVPSQELPRVLLELFQTLKPRGVLFSSNPRGNNEEGL